MIIQKYAQSNFKISSHQKSILIDPGIYNREIYHQSIDNFGKIDAIFITHKHLDHFDIEAVKALHQSQKPPIFSTEENVLTLKNQSVEAQVFKIGDSINIDSIKVKAVATNHHLRWGENTGQQVDAFGLIISCEGKNLYHTADTILPTPIPANIQLVFLPIGGRNVLTTEEARKLALQIKPKIIVPMHYDAPDDRHINPMKLASYFGNNNIVVKILRFGEVFNY